MQALVCIGDLPGGVDAGWFCLIKSGDFISFIETYDQCADTEWPDTSTLGISLLYTCDIFRDVFDRDRVLHCEAVRLCFQSSFVNQDSSIGVESGEGEANMSVDQADLRWCNPCIL